MQVTFEFAATTRDAVGDRRIERAVGDDATVEDAVRAVCTEFEGLGPLVFDGSGRVRPSVNVLLDGEPAAGSLDEPLPADATVTILPAVAGGHDTALDSALDSALDTGLDADRGTVEVGA